MTTPLTLDQALERVRAHNEHRYNRIIACLRDHDWLAAMILLYSAMDAMAWLARPSGKEPQIGDRFQAYVRRYVLLPDDEAKPIDLWGARCGVIHSHAAESTLRSARPIWYGAAGVIGPFVAVKLIPHSQLPKRKLRILPKGLARKWRDGANRCLKDVHADPAAFPDFLTRAGKLLHQRSPKFAKGGGA